MLNDSPSLASVFVIGSTNRVEDIDPAVLRSGRFGLTLTVNLPDLEGTKHILDIHTKGKRIDRKVDKNAIAEKMYKKLSSILLKYERKK